MPTVGGALASFVRRFAALRLSVSCHFRMANSAPALLVEIIGRLSEQPLAAQGILSQ